eukprot:jgi/Psemu1/324517/estExt_fgenesh1_pg.C_1530002
MIRTRKRDDDSQYNNSITSDGTTSLQLDASSMSATGSRSSLTFASSCNRRQPQRPRKRCRKTLSDALQSISLDRDVPQQILDMNAKGNNKSNSNISNINNENEFLFRKSSDGVGFVHATTTTTTTTTGSNPWAVRNHLNSQQRLDRRLDQHGNRQVATGQDGDVYYDCDDNSQLTSSSDECVPLDDDQEDGMIDEDGEAEDEDDQDSEKNKERSMTELEKAQRKVMLELVFGKNHREARKAASARKALPPRATEPKPVQIAIAHAHALPDAAPHKVVLSMPPALATVSTGTAVVAGGAATATATATGTTAPGDTTSNSVARSTDDESDSDQRDPADRKIEDLLRRSLENIQKGSHPLALPRNDNDNDDSDAFVTTPRKTQDDMAIDPEIYSRPTLLTTCSGAAPFPSAAAFLCSPMTVEKGPTSAIRANANANATGVTAISPKASVPAPVAAAASSAAGHKSAFATGATWCETHIPFPRQRSNSLPGGLDWMGGGGGMLGTADMETED